MFKFSLSPAQHMRLVFIPRAVILDFDGVIVNTERGKFAWLKRTLKRHGLRLRNDDFARMAGKKTAAFLAERFSDKLSIHEMRAIRGAWKRERMQHTLKYSTPIRGALPFIKALKARGISLCLATGTERLIVNKALRRFGLTDAFDVLITGNDCALSKPNPQVYMLAIKALRIPARHLVVVEDSAAGILAAKRAGLRCVAITTTQPRKQLKRADIIVRSFKELTKKLALPQRNV